MKQLTNDEIGALPTAPIFDGLPEELKEPGKLEEINAKLNAAMFADHKHATVKGFVRCKRCREKLDKRRQLLTELGFTSYEQYLEWKRVLGAIISKENLTFEK